jgi:hypothetical protein
VTIYRERLWPAPWLFIATALVMPASVLVFLPINLLAGVVTAVLLYAACLAALFVAAARIEVTDTEFIVGRARLPIGLVGELAGFRKEEAFLERGQRLDARAWLLLRGWIDPVVRVGVADPHDPAPYWLVSTRHPEAVIEALEKARVGAQG